jgi:hypothetical protein
MTYDTSRGFPTSMYEDPSVHEHFQLHQTSAGVTRHSVRKKTSESYQSSGLLANTLAELLSQHK